MNPADLQRLMHRLLDGEELSCGEFSAIESELMANPEARHEWRKLAAVHSAIEVHFTSQSTVADAKVVPIDRILARQRARIARIALMAAAAVILISVFGLWMVLAPQSSSAVAGVRVAPDSDFSLIHAESESKAGRGMLKEGSRLELRHGVAELDLPHDVRAVIQAPAEAVLLDARTLRLEHGSAYFEVASQEGRGFTVITPHQRIVDLGTAFGIAVREGHREVPLHVIEGEVRVDSLGGGAPGEILTAPRAVMLGSALVIRELDTSDDAFLRELPEKVETLLWDDFETGLHPFSEYGVWIDPTLVLDATGNAFPGMTDEAGWTFHTGHPCAIPVKNSGFEDDGKIVSKGRPIKHWESVNRVDWGWGIDRQRNGLHPTHGSYFGRLFGGNAIAQTLDTPIIAGTTYVLTLDVAVPAPEGPFPSAAVVRFFGSDRGVATALVGTAYTPSAPDWLRDRTLQFTATEAHATGQTLGISLHCGSGTALFDHIRLQAFGPEDFPKDAPEMPILIAPTGEQATRAPVLLARHPANGATDFDPNSALTLTFDRPIRLGTGRVILRNISNMAEFVITSGSPRMTVSGRTLTIRPPLELADGETHLGVLPGWELAVPAGLHNPADDVYKDRAAKRRVRHMATVAAGAPGTGIRRGICVIGQGRHYTASLAIGHRNAVDFPGYRIRLLSGDVVLAERTGSIPPGPPNHLETVGLSWNSADLPAGVALGDPLVLEIASEHTSARGDLDIDSVRVTAVSERQ